MREVRIRRNVRRKLSQKSRDFNVFQSPVFLLQRKAFDKRSKDLKLKLLPSGAVFSKKVSIVVYTFTTLVL